MPDTQGNLSAPRVFIYHYVGNVLTPIMNRVLAVSFEDNLKKIDKASITLDNRDLLAFDETHWNTGSHIYVSYGFYGRMSTPVHLKIRKVTGGKELTVEAVNAAAFGLDLKKKSKTWEHKSYSEVVREVAKDNGILTPTVQDVEEIHETITQSNQSDGVFMRDLADRQGFDFRIIGSSIHWGERNLAKALTKVYSYYPTKEYEAKIVDFTIDNDITRRPGRVKSEKRDPLDRKTVTETADNQNDKDRDILAGYSLTAGDETGKITLNKEEEPPDDDPSTGVTLVGGASKSAKGKFRAAARATVKMTLTLEGDPDTHAGDIVQVVGMGKKISGLYLVKCAKHTIKAKGAYTMTLEISTDGVNTGKKGKGTSLTATIARLKECWADFMKNYQGAVVTYLKGYGPSIRQLDALISGLTVSSYTIDIGNDIQARLGVLQGYLARFAGTAVESGGVEQDVQVLLELSAICYAAATDMTAAMVSAGMEKQEGRENPGEIEKAELELTFDKESGAASLGEDPNVVLESKAAENDIKLVGGKVNGKPIPPEMLEKITSDAAEAGLNYD